uniref:Trafficking protein particle complex subunit 8 n=1 Tax=Oncorhynchus kisutch TaxID=8019 RepID=A0A8C7HCG0_ONCKI
MAQCVQSVQEFIQDSFVPMVAVLCSEDAEKVTRKNNLNFSELLRPFCRLTSEGHMRDPSNQLQVVKNLRISVNNVVTRPSVPSSGVPGHAHRRLLSEVVLTCQPAEGGVANVITAGDYDLNISATTPWFEAYRESFLQSMPASDHEFLNHYLACLLVVSSSEAVPVEKFLKLSQEQHRIQHSGEYTNPKWFIPNTLKYYVLLHDMSQGDEQRADSVYEDMKQRYGAQGCYLLKVNSRTAAAGADEQIPDPWSQYLHKSSLQSQVQLGPRLSVPSIYLLMYRTSEVDGHDSEEKGSLDNTHPLQLDTPSDTPGSLDALRAVAVETKPPPLTTGVAAATSHGACLTLNDHDRIRLFIQEFTFRGLLPHIEKNIRQLNDQLVSRKGLSRSLFSATKKWFGGGKVPEKSIAELKNTSGLLYPPEAPELQIRKMADLCFLVQLYDLAYSCYHTAKKDFLSDQAMLYAAGALEMAAVSAFLQVGAPRPYPAHYMDTAIQTYRDVSKNMVLAERCALLSAEVLKSQAKYSDAATLLIKMTSEDSDLRSALLLEQAAHCFINMRNPMVRKFAFHMILAGHRFSKAGQKRHALRCYCQAMQVYKGKGWSLAEDHINFTIGRQSFTLRQPENAVTAFRHILTNDSQQTSTQQGAFLREYLYVYKNVTGACEVALPQLPLPCINSSATRVYFGHERRLAEGEKQAATHVSLDQEFDRDLAAMWQDLEEQVVAAAKRGVVPATFQSTQCCLNSQTDNLRFPLAVVEEPIIVEVVFRNPLKVPLVLSDLSLLWKFTLKDFNRPQTQEDSVGDAVPISNEKEAISINFFCLIPLCLLPQARLKLLPHQTGQLNILGLVYNLASTSSTGDTTINTAEGTSVRGRQDLEIQGPRLNQTKEEKTSVSHGPDRRLDPTITPPMPLLEVFFLQFPTALLCGEIRKAYVEFCNMSRVTLCGLRVASTHPDFFTFGSSSLATPLTPLSPTSFENCSAYKTLATPPGATPGSVAAVTLVSEGDFGSGTGLRGGVSGAGTGGKGITEIPLGEGTLKPGESTQLPMWLRGPDQEGVHEIHFLFYYESAEKGGKISHRVLRHTVFICASRSLSVRATACRSNTLPEEEEEERNGSMLVFVDVENINSSEAGVREFHIAQVSSSSKQWRLHKCINPAEDKDCKLTSRERGKLCFRATRCKPLQEEKKQSAFPFSKSGVSSLQIITSTTPCADFFFRRCQPLESLRPPGVGHGGGDKDIAGVVRKCNEVDLDIIILWKAFVVEDNKQVILEGQLHVALQTIDKEACSLTPKEEAQEMVLLKFKPELPPPMTRPSMEQLSHLIKTNLQYPESYSHPFNQKSLCMVPVTLTLSNCSLAQVDVIIDLRHKTTSPESLEVHGSFTWLGQTQFKMQLGAQEVMRVQLRACFLHAGVYNLGTPRVFAKLADQGAMCETSQQTATPALIIIINST